MPDQISIKCVVMRGGTSKGIMFAESDLPRDAKQRDRLIACIDGQP